MPLFLALDQSTSATKALLLDRDGHVLDRESLEHRQHYPRPGWAEHDAEEIWRNALAVLRSLLERHRDRWDELESLSISNQRETALVFERASGQPLYPAIVWHCQRSADICEKHLQAGNAERIEGKTGLRIDAYFSATKWQWMVENHAGLEARLASGEALCGTIDAYLIYRLTRGEVFATDHTNASRTSLFDIKRLDWDGELCELFKVPPNSLPEVRESTASFGETDIDGLLPRPLPICGVMGDSQASLFAQRCYEPGAAKVTFGSGSSILLNIGAQPLRSGQGVVTTLAWVHQGVPTYALEGIIISSAATLAWLKDQLGLLQDIAECESLATAVDSNEGVYLVPAFSGLGLPHWESSARAAIVGLSGHSDRRHVVRAGLESIAYQIRDALEAMREDSGLNLRRIHGDGGPTSNEFLMRFVADITGVELRVNTMPDCSPLGAAFAGMLGRGHYASLQDLAQAPRDDRVYLPQMNPETADNLHAGWKSAVRQVLFNLR